MKRMVPSLALTLLIACGEVPQESCSPTYPYPYEPPELSKPMVPSASFGPGRITYVNSDPLPGATLSGCGDTFGGCQERLKIVFNVRPDVDLRSTRLHVTFTGQTGGVLECFSTAFDLPAGESFPVQVSCPSSPASARTPFTTQTMTVETGPAAERIEQAWKASYTFLP
jgi:hypothetical protein